MSIAESLELYYWPTPNGFKITIMLAELAVPYTLKPIDITKGEQHTQAFSQLSPGHKIPAIRDLHPLDGRDVVEVFESAAILIYLAEKYQRFYPPQSAQRSECLQWLFWQVGGLGPMAGQAHHFRLYAPEKIDYAIQRYTAECQRLYAVMDQRLQDRDYLVGQYSIADIACLPWIFRHERQGQDLDDFSALKHWYQRLMARPAVAEGLKVAAGLRDDQAFVSEQGRNHLFPSQV